MVVGDPGVGKTYLLKTFTTGKYPDDFIPTVIDQDIATVTVSYSR